MTATRPATQRARRTVATTDHALVAFVFPGQGSQYPGMVRDLQRCGPQSRSLLQRAEHRTGLPIVEFMTTADAATIADPHLAQVLVFLTSTVLLSELRSRGWRPTAVAGHSLGEYSALVAAGVLTWDEALRLVDARGRAMAAAAAEKPGAMAALVGLDSATVAGLCRAASQGAEQVGIANVNSPSQLIVSGTTSAVAEVVQAARVAGALRAKPLPVGGAYHSALMRAAAEKLRPLLSSAELSRPTTTLISSATGKVVDDLDDYRRALANQVLSPVQWRSTVSELAGRNIGCFIEVGPGRVLSGLGRENARDTARYCAPELLAQQPVGSGV